MNSVIKSSDADRYLLTVVYSCHKRPGRGADRRLDVVSPRVLELGAWQFMRNGGRVGMFHEPGHEGAATLVESSIYRGPPWDVHGDGSVVIKAGDWLAGLILTPPAWALYKSGKIRGVSLQGDADRKPASAATLARQKG